MDVKRGFLWSFCFFVLFLSSLEVLAHLLIDFSFWLFLPMALLWFWRLKFVFIDLNPKHIKVDIWINAITLLARYLYFGYLLSHGEISFMTDSWHFLDGSIMIIVSAGLLMLIGFLFYPLLIIYSLGLEELMITGILFLTLHPIHLLYLTTEIRLLKRMNLQLQKNN